MWPKNSVKEISKCNLPFSFYFPPRKRAAPNGGAKTACVEAGHPSSAQSSSPIPGRVHPRNAGSIAVRQVTWKVQRSWLGCGNRAHEPIRTLKSAALPLAHVPWSVIHRASNTAAASSHPVLMM